MPTTIQRFTLRDFVKYDPAAGRLEEAFRGNRSGDGFTLAHSHCDLSVGAPHYTRIYYREFLTRLQHAEALDQEALLKGVWRVMKEEDLSYCELMLEWGKKTHKIVSVEKSTGQDFYTDKEVPILKFALVGA